MRAVTHQGLPSLSCVATSACGPRGPTAGESSRPLGRAPRGPASPLFPLCTRPFPVYTLGHVTDLSKPVSFFVKGTVTATSQCGHEVSIRCLM